MTYARFRDGFAAALDPRLHTIEWLDGEVAAGRALFWCSENAAILAEVRFYPTGAKDLHGLVAAGDLGEIVAVLIPRAEAWAREAGCLATVIESRPGWAKALPDYHVTQVALRKEL